MTPDEERIEEIRVKAEDEFWPDGWPNVEADMRFVLTQLTTAQQQAKDQLRTLRHIEWWGSHVASLMKVKHDQSNDYWRELAIWDFEKIAELCREQESQRLVDEAETEGGGE